MEVPYKNKERNNSTSKILVKLISTIVIIALLIFCVSKIKTKIEFGNKIPDGIATSTSVTDTPAPMENPIRTLDEEGILELNKTKEDGRTWFSKWSKESPKTIESGDRDPLDPEFIMRGNGKGVIDDKGNFHLQGDTPRMYVYDPLKKKKWGDVEITVYSKRESELKSLSSQGIVIGARSNHQDVTLQNPCAGTTYYGRLLYDGRAVFQKELIHEELYSSNQPSEYNKVKWNTSDGTMPLNMWIGLKFIVRTNSDGKSVNLELYRDLTDGLNGGTWDKVAQYTDKGVWSTDSTIDVYKTCGFPETRVLIDPAVSVFIRNDQVNDVLYKKFSIREIE